MPAFVQGMNHGGMVLKSVRNNERDRNKLVVCVFPLLLCTIAVCWLFERRRACGCADKFNFALNIQFKYVVVVVVVVVAVAAAAVVVAVGFFLSSMFFFIPFSFVCLFV